MTDELCLQRGLNETAASEPNGSVCIHLATPQFKSAMKKASESHKAGKKNKPKVLKFHYNVSRVAPVV